MKNCRNYPVLTEIKTFLQVARGQYFTFSAKSLLVFAIKSEREVVVIGVFI